MKMLKFKGQLFQDTHPIKEPNLKLTFARWFWNHTCTTRTLNPVSLESCSRTLRHGLGVISNAALKSSRCCDVKMVRGRLLLLVLLCSLS